MIADHGIHTRLYMLLKGNRYCIRVKQRCRRHIDFGFQGFQRPGHRVVLIAGYHRSPSGRHQAFDGDIQPMGRVFREHHPLRISHAEQFRQFAPALEGYVCGPHSGGVPAPARRTHGQQGIPHSGRHGGWLLESRCRTVKIDHI